MVMLGLYTSITLLTVPAPWWLVDAAVCAVTKIEYVLVATRPSPSDQIVFESLFILLNAFVFVKRDQPWVNGCCLK